MIFKDLDSRTFFGIIMAVLALILCIFMSLAIYSSFVTGNCLTSIATKFCNDKSLDFNRLDNIGYKTFYCSSHDREVEIKQYNFLDDELIKCGEKHG